MHDLTRRVTTTTAPITVGPRRLAAKNDPFGSTSEGFFLWRYVLVADILPGFFCTVVIFDPDQVSGVVIGTDFPGDQSSGVIILGTFAGVVRISIFPVALGAAVQDVFLPKELTVFIGIDRSVQV